MEPGDDREVVLFLEALRRAVGPEREALFDQACAGDRALRGWLEALLQAHDSPDPFLEPPTGRQATELALLGFGFRRMISAPE